MTAFWKGKTIAAYIALEHHTRYITPIMEKLSGMGANVIYIVGQAERSQEITAIERGLNYFHVFDFLSAGDAAEIDKNYQAMKARFSKAISTDVGFSAIAPTVLDKTLYATAQEYCAFRNLFKRFHPDICIALHENNRWGKLFSFQAKKANIPFITLQEGLFTTADLLFIVTGHIQNSTLGLVWGQGSKAYLCDYEAPEDRAIPVGNTLLANKIAMLKKHRVRDKKRDTYGYQNQYVVLLLFSAILHPAEEFIPVLEAFCDAPLKKLVVKFHPITTQPAIKQWMDRIPENLKANAVFIHGQEDTYDLIAMSDLCVLSDTSTTGLEALAIGKPLVFLALKSPKVMKSSLPGEGVALEYSPEELKTILSRNDRLPFRPDKHKVKAHLARELTDPEKTIETTVRIMEDVVSANQDVSPCPLDHENEISKKWSIVIPVCNDPDQLLFILESITVHSGDHDYEVILICPEAVSEQVRTVLDSLKGDVVFLTQTVGQPTATAMNTAGPLARGQFLVFPDIGIAPGPSWLDAAADAFDRFGPEKVLGGKITDASGNMVHGGMLVNKNHSPVPAFVHMNEKEPCTDQTRSFKMVDQFIAVSRDVFLAAGGFHARAGKYKFLDFCLRRDDAQEASIIYTHDIKMLQLFSAPKKEAHSEAAYFYARWHGMLWDNETAFYRKAGISETQLGEARMRQAMAAAPY